MRHLKAGRKLGRTASHRRAMYSNMVASLVTHGRIETTEAKAKELRSIADRTIHWAVGANDLTKRGAKKLSDIERARLVHCKRMARRVLKDETALERLFAEVGPQLVGRPGGYTRVLKTRNRLGDAAPMALVQLVGEAGQLGDASAPEPTKSTKASRKESSKKAEKPEKPEKSAKADKADKKAQAKKGGKSEPAQKSQRGTSRGKRGE